MFVTLMAARPAFLLTWMPRWCIFKTFAWLCALWQSGVGRLKACYLASFYSCPFGLLAKCLIDGQPAKIFEKTWDIHKLMSKCVFVAQNVSFTHICGMSLLFCVCLCFLLQVVRFVSVLMCGNVLSRVRTNISWRATHRKARELCTGIWYFIWT